MICKNCKSGQAKEDPPDIIFCPACGWFEVQENGDWKPIDEPAKPEPEPITEPEPAEDIRTDQAQPTPEPIAEKLSQDVKHPGFNIFGIELDFSDEGDDD